MKSEYLESLRARRDQLENRIALLRSDYISAGRNTFQRILEHIADAEGELLKVNRAIKDAMTEMEGESA